MHHGRQTTWPRAQTMHLPLFFPSSWVGHEVAPLSGISQATLSQFYFPGGYYALLQRGRANWFLWNYTAAVDYLLTLQPLIEMQSVRATDKLHGGESVQGLEMWEQKAVSPSQPGASTSTHQCHGLGSFLSVSFTCIICWAVAVTLSEVSKMARTYFPVGTVVRMCLPVQRTRVQSLVQEDPTCLRAAKHMCHDYWALALEWGATTGAQLLA